MQRLLSASFLLLLACSVLSPAVAQNASYPGTIYNAISYYLAPTSIPQNGYLTGVVEYASNCSQSVNIHFEISDPEKSYLLAGGQTQVIPTPSYGSVQFNLSPFQNLNTTDTYLLAVFSACTLTSQANGGTGNDYLIETAVSYYGPVVVAPLPTTSTLTMYNPPTTIPNSGVIQVYAQWSSNYVGYVSLHLDLTDVTAGYVGDGNSYLNVSSPGSGVVIFTINITQAALSQTDNIILDYYLTYGNYTTAAGPGNDYLHQAASGQFGVTVVPAASLTNSLIITGTPSNPGTVAAPRPPTYIPLSGTFTINLAWQLAQRGVVNVHVDISDVTRNYAYDGGMTTQVVGPGAGNVQFVMNYNYVGGNITAGEQYQLHVYLTRENDTQVFGAGVDYLHSITSVYYPVVVGQAAPINSTYPGTIYNAISYYLAPTSIPQNGYLTGVVEYASNCSQSVNIHFEISDPEKSYLLAGGQTQVIPTPSYGSVQFNLSPFQNLNTTDTYLLAVFSACTLTSQANGGTGNDYLIETAVSYYGPVVVAPLPTTSTLTMYNPPTTIPNSGVIQVYAQWSSNYVGYVSLHLDLTDVTAGYVGDGNSYLNVSSPGSGVVIFTINITQAALSQTDNIILDYYLTYGNYTTAAGPGNDYLHQAASGQFGVTVVPAASLTNSLIITGTPSNPGTVAAPRPPTYIPLSGTFTINLAWQLAQRGVVNVHVDISDVTRNYAYDGGMTTQVVGPGAGNVQFVMNYNYVGGNITAGEQYQLHVYLTRENDTQVFGAGVDYLHSITSVYYPVVVGQAAPINSTYPGTIYNAISYYLAPTSIPQNGYLTGVVEYASNCSQSVNIHFEISDPEKSYLLAGGQTQVIPTPSYGSVQFNLSPFQNLNTTDTYLLAVFSACTLTSQANGGTGNDYLIETAVSYYGPVVVAPLPTTSTLTMYNPPTTIPNSGVIQVYAQWSSNYVGYVSLHLDLTDVTAGYVGDGNSYLNVSSPGSGVVIFTINITQAALSQTDNIILDYYLTYGNYTTAAGPGNDYLHQAASGQFGVTVVPAASLTNSLIITGTPSNPGTVAAPRPPTYIPLSGTFTINLAWQLAQRGVVNVHVDISDVTRNYAYDGGMTTQVVGPGAGNVQFVMNYNYVGGNITAGEQYQLHVYLTRENDTQVFGAGVDYLHSITSVYYPVVVGQAAPINSTYPGTIYNAISYYLAPTSIPQNGYLTGVVEYASNCSQSVNIHFEISDPEKSYLLAGGQTQVIPTPSYGSVQFNLSPFQNLNTTDTYLLAVFSACTLTSQANGGTGNDYLIETAVSYYGPVVVAPLPTTSTLTMYNPPTTIPNSGVIQVYAQWSSNYVGYVSLHLDLTDVTAGYVGDGNSYLNVSSPGSGVVIFTINITQAALSQTDNIILDYYLTYGNYTTAAGPGNDYLHQAASGQFGVTVVPAASLTNSLIITGTPSNPGTVAAPRPPTYIPLSGTFTINLAWQLAQRGVVNVHVDISDVTRNYAYDGGMTTQVVGPGAGNVQFVMNYNYVGGNITAGEQYQLHVYLTRENDTQVFGAGVDYLHSITSVYYPVTVGSASGPGSSSSSSSSSGLSGGAIAGIVIGSVVGALILLVVLLALCRRRGELESKASNKSAHMPHQDEPSHAGESGVEMGEVQEAETD